MVGSSSWRSTVRNTLVGSLLVTAVAVADADAETIDVSIPWPDKNFHTQNLKSFAEKAAQRTDGRVEFIINSGGSLGIAGADHLRAVRDGLAGAAEFHSGLQAGDAPLAGIFGVPYLIADYDELAIFAEIARPDFVALLESNGQTLCYMVPWPSQNVFAKVEIDAFGDLAGLKIRTNDATTTAYYGDAGVVTVSMPWSDVVPALASGAVEGVTTSTSSAMDGSLWEFLTHIHRFNHNWAMDWFTISHAALAGMSESDRAAIMDLCREVEPAYWQVSMAQDDENLAKLVEKGMTTVQPSAALLAELRGRATGFWQSLPAQMGPEAEAIVTEFRSKVGR
ncbi:MAG: TRAP transporter substrate-binding protein [Sneathiellaceae bacterium]